MKARLIITTECYKKCSYCVKDFYDKAINLNSLFPLKCYETINVVGGEPLMEPKRTYKILDIIRKFNQKAKIYLTTSSYAVDLVMMLPTLDGITFVFHEGAAAAELARFNRFQVMATRFPEKTYRLIIHPAVKLRIPIQPNIWERVEFKVPAPAKVQGETCYKLVIP